MHWCARDLQALTAQLNQSRSGEAAQTQELARLRLDLLAANQVVSGLDAADQRALALLAQRSEVLVRLHVDIEASVKRQKQLADARVQALSERDRHLHALDTLVENTRKALADTEAFKTQREAADAASLRARYADEKADQAEQDRSQKRLPYEADKLFAYLWGRRYAFPEYAVKHIISKIIL